MSRRLIAALILTLFPLAACGQVRPSQPATAGYHVFLQEGFGSGSQQVTVRDSGTGAIVRHLPLGTPAPDWSRYYTVTQASGAARLTALDPMSGQPIRVVAIPAGFNLPDYGYGGMTAGLSPNGQWLTLVDQSRSAGTMTTSFLVGASSLSTGFKTIRISGSFDFDALSNDGNSLYLIQRMSDPRHYQVRLFDVVSQTLMPQPIVDKREPTEPMNGLRGDSAMDVTRNYVYTVYVRQGGPFIHALPLDQPFAWCVDLPSKAADDIERQWHWSLAISKDGAEVFAVNTALGSVAAIMPGEPPAVVKTTSLALNPARGLLGGLVAPAEAKGPLSGGAVLSADGRTLFAIGETGVVAIDTATLKVRQQILNGESIDSMRLSSDGKWLYVAASGSSNLWQINPATLTVTGSVKGVTNPWNLLWAEPAA